MERKLNLIKAEEREKGINPYGHFGASAQLFISPLLNEKSVFEQVMIYCGSSLVWCHADTLTHIHSNLFLSFLFLFFKLFLQTILLFLFQFSRFCYIISYHKQKSQKCNLILGEGKRG